jgi:ABC-type glycerol-3-phosphate transport system substrate-binding protein
MHVRTGLALALAVVLSGCGGTSHTVSTGEAETTTTSAAEQAEAAEQATEKRKEEEEKLKEQREEERRIHEHEPGHFGP